MSPDTHRWRRRCASLLACTDPPLEGGTGPGDRPPLRYSQFLADQMPKASLSVVPQAGHMVMLERPQMTADLVKEFLSQLE